jgi:hypothetical protein
MRIAYFVRLPGLLFFSLPRSFLHNQKTRHVAPSRGAGLGGSASAARAAEPPIFAFTTLRSVNLPLVGFTAEPRNEWDGRTCVSSTRKPLSSSTDNQKAGCFDFCFQRFRQASLRNTFYGIRDQESSEKPPVTVPRNPERRQPAGARRSPCHLSDDTTSARAKTPCPRCRGAPTDNR